jgi:peptidyl-prolyl cis-trans isomerase D
MLAAIRGFAKSPFAVLLMGLLIISFAVWGVRDMFKGTSSNWVIQAGSHEVSADEYKRTFDQVISNAEQQMGRVVTPEEAVAQNVDRDILSKLSDENAVGELVKRLGVQPDDKLVLAALARDPSFTDPLTGRFSDTYYHSLMANNKIKPESYEANLRDQIAERQFAAGLGGSAKAPRIYAAVLASAALESRDADYIELGLHSVPAPAKPTDAQLLAFMKDNAAIMKRPEFRTLSLVRFSAAAIAPTMTPDAAAVQKRFDLEKARLAVPERRAFVQIMLKDAGQAAAAAARLVKGETADAVAKAYGVTATSYPATSQRAIPDQQVGNAVFALQPGKSSGPIKTAFGAAVVKLTAITPAKPASLDEARGKIVEELKGEQAQQKVFDQMQKYSDAHDSGAPLAKAAETAGVKVYTLGPLTAQGVDRATRQPTPSLTPKMLTEAFALPAGGETEVQDLGKGEYYAIRVNAIEPAALPPLEEVRGPLTQRVMAVDLVKRLQARATALSARIKKGEAVDKVAASANLPARHIEALSRATMSQHQELGQEFLGNVLGGKPGDVFVAQGGGGVMVGKIGAAKPGNLGQVAIATEQARGQTTQMMMSDFVETLRNIARERIKPKVNLAKARQAIDLTPETEGSSAKPAKPAKAG